MARRSASSANPYHECEQEMKTTAVNVAPMALIIAEAAGLHDERSG